MKNEVFGVQSSNLRENSAVSRWEQRNKRKWSHMTGFRTEVYSGRDFGRPRFDSSISGRTSIRCYATRTLQEMNFASFFQGSKKICQKWPRRWSENLQKSLLNYQVETYAFTLNFTTVNVTKSCLNNFFFFFYLEKAITRVTSDVSLY